MKWLVIIMGVLVLVGAGWFFLQPSDSKKMMETTGGESAMEQSDGETMQKEDVMMEKEGNGVMEEKGSKEEVKEQEESMMKKDDAAMMGKESGGMKAAGTYIPYSAQALSDTVSKRRVLFFYANWCPLCKPADADLALNVKRLPSDVAVIRVNYNDTETDQAEKDLAQKYGVTYQHTFVQIDGNGNVVTKWNGGKTDELLKNIK